MKRQPTPSFIVSLIIALLVSSLPGALRPDRSTAAPLETRSAERTAGPLALLAPTGYDHLHHAAPSTPWSAFAGRGVNAVLGNFVLQEQDLAVPGRGLPVAFTRTYNSASVADGPLGPGWTHSFNLAVLPDGADAMLVRNADGRLDRFSQQPDGSYTAPSGIHNLLTRAADGTYSLRTKDQTVYRFDTGGRLISITDRNGNTILLTYTGSDLTRHHRLRWDGPFRWPTTGRTT